MKIAIASDHAGFDLKEKIAKWLEEQSYQVLDFGAFSDGRVDYPDYAFPASESVASGVADLGVLICGSGTGMAITANKVTGIRAASCGSEEMARLARQHNNANIITYGARLVSEELAKKMTEAFLTTDFEGGRHMIRVEKIHKLTGW
jgi:ribose 5-phosphate isomerase B